MSQANGFGVNKMPFTTRQHVTVRYRKETHIRCIVGINRDRQTSNGVLGQVEIECPEHVHDIDSLVSQFSS